VVLLAYSWIAVDAFTGAPLAELPDFTVDTVSLVLGQTQTAVGSFPIASDATPVDWLFSTEPWSVAICLLSDDAPNPIGGWYINYRDRDQTDAMTIPLVTAEGYFERRWVGTPGAFTSVDQNTIAGTLVTLYAATPPVGSTGLSGMPITVNVVGGAGNAITRTEYKDTNDQTLATALQELMGVKDGPEYTVTWVHLTSPERYLPVFNVGTRIGSPVTAGLGPQAVFEMGGTSEGGSVTSVTLTEDYSSGKGANFVTATGMVAADGTRPQQSVSAVGSRRLAIEYRWNPSTSITSASDLLAHALQTLPLMQNGSRALTLSTIASEGPILGKDWFMGDTVGYSIGGLNANGVESVPAFPGGLVGQARVVGIQFQPDIPTPIVTPILAGV
jgi:hypothetical protein